MSQSEKASANTSKGSAPRDPRRYSGPIELVTTPILWWSGLGLGAVFILLLWSIKGRVPQLSQGVGAFSYPYRITTIPISSQDTNARIKSLLFTPGEFVESGDILAEVAQPTSYVEVLQAKLQLDLAISELKTAENSYNSLIKSANQQANAYLGLEKTGQELLKQGVISKTTYLQTASSYNQQLGTAQSYKNNIITAKQSVTSAKIQYEAARKKYDSTGLIRAVKGGIVLQVNYKPGDPIGSEPLMALLDTSGYGKEGIPKSLYSLLSSIKGDLRLFFPNTKIGTRQDAEDQDTKLKMPLYFISYFDQANGGKINIGMEARILPNNIQANTVGTLRGIVKGVFPLPVGQKDSSAVIGSTALSQSLLNNSEQSYIQVIIGLVPNQSFKSGYEWIGGKGPETSFLIPRVGDAGTVNIITEEKPPITIALPSLRSAFGLPMGL